VDVHQCGETGRTGRRVSTRRVLRSEEEIHQERDEGTLDEFPRAPIESWSPTTSVRADIADEYAPVRGVARRHASGDAGDIAAGRTT
jgi:hypothetical protein